MKVIRVGGNDPIQVSTWEDRLTLLLLQHLYDCGGNRKVRDIFGFFEEELTPVERVKGGKIAKVEIEVIFTQMVRNRWVEISEFNCDCPPERHHTPDEFLSHAKRLRLTEKGLSKVPACVLCGTCGNPMEPTDNNWWFCKNCHTSEQWKTD